MLSRELISDDSVHDSTVSSHFKSKTILEIFFKFLQRIRYIYIRIWSRSMEEFTIASSFVALFSATVVMVVMATYTANLASYFSSQTVYSGIQGFQDIGYGSGQIRPDQVCIPLGGSIQVWWESIYGPSSSYKANEIKFSTPECYDVLEDPNNDCQAIVVDSPGAEYRVLNDPGCDLMLVGDLEYPSGYAMVVEANSYLREPLSVEILRLSEEQVLANIDNRYFQTGSCANSDPTNEEETEQISLDSMAGVFILGGAAMIFSIMMFFVATPDTSIELENPDIPQTKRKELESKVQKMKSIYGNSGTQSILFRAGHSIEHTSEQSMEDNTYVKDSDDDEFEVENSEDDNVNNINNKDGNNITYDDEPYDEANNAAFTSSTFNYNSNNKSEVELTDFKHNNNNNNYNDEINVSINKNADNQSIMIDNPINNSKITSDKHDNEIAVENDVENNIANQLLRRKSVKGSVSYTA